MCLPGCPPPARSIAKVILDLLDGRKRDGNLSVKFG
jgi:coenzyme F420-reducing hydrogenase gamma subunit